MTTQIFLDPAGDPTAHIDDRHERAHHAHAPGRTAGAFIRRRLGRAADAFVADIAALLLTFDGCLVALDDDPDAVAEI